MLKRFPFGDSLMKDLGILQPEKASSCSKHCVVRASKEEVTDLLLSPGGVTHLISMPRNLALIWRSLVLWSTRLHKTDII